MERKYVCPVCGGTLVYERIDDGTSIVEIEPDGRGITEITCDSDGSTRVYCKNNKAHEIDPETWDAVVLIAEDFGY